jgi:hypothetical protein
MEATMQGTAASTELIEAEQKTRQRMNEARQKLHAAMAQFASDYPEPPE